MYRLIKWASKLSRQKTYEDSFQQVSLDALFLSSQKGADNSHVLPRATVW